MTARHPIPEAALEHHVAILGKTGSGKSYAAQGIVERLIAKRRRVCVIDPTDRYWGLRLLSDGRTPSGHEVVIFGGARADLPLGAAHGAAIAEIVGTAATPVILATRLMTVGERTRFFTDFAETLLRRNEGPLHLVVDEAHLFAPQTRVASVESGRMLHAANNLVSLGRGIGLRIMLLSQRPAKLHKDSLTQVETLVAFRLIAPQDRAAIREWVREWADEATGAEMMASLPALPTGTAWVWAPELDVLRKGAFPEIATFDSGRPFSGRTAPTLAPIDVAAVRARLESVAREAIANDPRTLRAEIARLNRQMEEAARAAAKAGQAPDARALEEAERRGEAKGYGRGKIEGYGAAAADIRRITAGLDAALRPALKALDGLRASVRELEAWADAAAKIRPRPATPPRTAAKSSVRPKPPAALKPSAPSAARPSGGDIALSGPERRILNALASWAAMGQAQPSNAQVAWLARYSPTSTSYSNPRGGLRVKGLIDYPAPDRLALTAEGSARAEAAALNGPLAEHVLKQLPGPERRILAALVENYPDALANEDLAQAAGYSPTSTSYTNPRGALRSKELICYPAAGQVRAADWLFP